MKTTILAIFLAILALAAAGFAWERNQALEAAKVELADANARLQKAEARIKPLEESVAALRKETATQQQALEQMRGELVSTKAFFEAERDFGLRLRDELSKVKELLAAAFKGRGPQAAPTPALPPGMVMPSIPRPPPMRVERAGSGAAYGAPAPAR
jgi:septal ring factor EnvC (AmiA/AmiB activator)